MKAEKLFAAAGVATIGATVMGFYAGRLIEINKNIKNLKELNANLDDIESLRRTFNDARVEDIEELRNKIEHNFKDINLGYSDHDLELLYGTYSELKWCAGWLDLDEEKKDDFVEWMIKHGFLDGSKQTSGRYKMSE